MKKKKKHDFDLIVIGSGPAGEKGAAQAAYFGKRTAIIEHSPRVGGTSVNTGAIPSKTLRETALYYSNLRQRSLSGIDFSIRGGMSLEDFMYRKTLVVNNEWNLIYKNLERHDIELIFGNASFIDAQTLRVERDGSSEQYSAKVFLIATGSVPNGPGGLPVDHRVVYESDSILSMDKIPKSLAIVGAGAIGCEYATIFSALGISVTLIDAKPHILSIVDREIAERLRTHLQNLGMTILLKETVERVETVDNGARLHLKSGGTLYAERVLIAGGRFGNTRNLGLERLKILPTSAGFIPVNARYQTRVPNIYAAGDVIGAPFLASTAMEQARVAMCYAFGLEYKKAVSPYIPLAVYTIPEIAYAGATEEQLRERGTAYVVGKSSFEMNARGQIIGELDGLIKLLFSPSSQKLLGVHIIGEGASELIHLGLFVLAQGLTIDYFIQSLFNFPSLSEVYKYAAYDGLQNLQKVKKR